MSRYILLIFYFGNVFATTDFTCTNPVPGLGDFARGVDITEFDIRSPVGSVNSGLKKTVIGLSCNQTRPWRMTDGTTSQIPDQLSYISPNPSSSFTMEVHIYKTQEDLRNQLNTEASGTGVYKKFAFSKAISYESMRHTITNSDSYLSEVIYKVGAYEAGFEKNIALIEDITDWVKRMSSEGRTFESHPAEYHSIIENYGTHYLDSASFGGYLNLRVETSVTYFYQHSVQEYEANVETAFLKWFKLSGSVSESSIDKEFESSSNFEKYHYGGNVNLFDDEDVTNWQKTVADNPGILSAHLKPIADIIPDEMVQASVAEATMERVARSNLKELQELVTSSRRKLGSHDVFEEFDADLSRLENLPLGKFNLSGFEALATLINWHLVPPEWFLYDTKLCLKWQPFGDSGQCGGDIGREVCSKVGSMTPHYMDNTDDRQGGCKVQWGIQSLGPETWFKDVQICYRWDDVSGTEGQCFAESDEVCASVDDFTSTYLDQTDNSPGGCEISWKLNVPEEAPLWMKTSQLCLDFYSDGDGDQCKPRETGVKKCAMANTWTRPYPDETDDRKGACFLSWGIIPCCSDEIVQSVEDKGGHEDSNWFVIVLASSISALIIVGSLLGLCLWRCRRNN